MGIIVKDTSGWNVIHAVPGETDKEHPIETIKKETLSQFFAPDKAISGAIFRLDSCQQEAVYAAKKAEQLFHKNILFDHDYDTNDSTKMYCTELIWYVYQKTGIDISEGRRSAYPAMRYQYILPSDITDNQQLKQVFFFKREK